MSDNIAAAGRNWRQADHGAAVITTSCSPREEVLIEPSSNNDLHLSVGWGGEVDLYVNASDLIEAVTHVAGPSLSVAGWRPPPRRIETVEERDALPVDSLVLWTVDDHPGYYDQWPVDAPIPPVLWTTLFRTPGGWCTHDEPIWERPEADLPPLPWRLLWSPDAEQQAVPMPEPTRQAGASRGGHRPVPTRLAEVARDLYAKGWRWHPRQIETASGIAGEATGTIIRFREGGVGSIDHGPRGWEWTGLDTAIHLLLPGGGCITAREVPAVDLPATVLYTPTETGGTGA